MLVGSPVLEELVSGGPDEDEPSLVDEGLPEDPVDIAPPVVVPVLGPPLASLLPVDEPSADGGSSSQPETTVSTAANDHEINGDGFPMSINYFAM